MEMPRGPPPMIAMVGVESVMVLGLVMKAILSCRFFRGTLALTPYRQICSFLSIGGNTYVPRLAPHPGHVQAPHPAPHQIGDHPAHRRRPRCWRTHRL